MKSVEVVSRPFLFRFGVALAVILLSLAVVSAWLAFRAQQVQTNLTASVGLAPRLVEQVKLGDSKGAEKTLDEVKHHIQNARSAGTDPIWRAASLLPFLGPNFGAVTEITVAADDVLTRAAAPVLEEFDAKPWQELISADGKVDVDAISKMAPELTTAHVTVEQSHKRLSAIDEQALLPLVRAPLGRVTTELEDLSEALSSGSSLANVLPAMLGSEETRSYLLLIQNNAEIRATGGIPGALAVLEADQGELALTGHGSASQMGEFSPAIIVDQEQSAIYSNRIGRFIQSANLTPEFPTVGETAARMWEHRNQGTSVDGVIAFDPIALSNILKATGPVQLDFEDSQIAEVLGQSGLPTSLTSDNVIPTLLSDVYAAIEDPALQDVYFAAVASEVFDALMHGSGDRADLIRALVASATDGRFRIWSANADEQEIIATKSIAGSVTGAESGGASFGAYFNDGTGAKMDYYVRRTVQLSRSCTSEGYRQYTLKMTLTNTAPLDAGMSLPEYVTGAGAFGIPPGTVQTNLVGYGPPQAQLQTARMNGETVQVGSHRHSDRPVGILTTRLEPGQTVTAELDFTNVAQQSTPTLDVTPTIQPSTEVVLPLLSDPACS